MDCILDRFVEVREVGDREWLAVCPAHDDFRSSLSIKQTPDGTVLMHCFGGCRTNDVLVAVGLTFRDLFPHGRLNGDAFHATHKREIAKPCVLHEVYEAILSHLALSNEHFKNLLDRGLTEWDISKNRYKTLTWWGWNKAMKFLKGVFSREELLRVPGIQLDHWGAVVPVLGLGELLIPVRDFEGHAVAIKVRRGDDHPSGKYAWLSGGRSPNVGAPLHYAGTPATPNTSSVVIVEGPLKADVVHCLDREQTGVGKLIIGIPGVSSWKAVLGALGRFPCQVKTVTLAFDLDWKWKPAVAECLRSLAVCLDSDYNVQIATWDHAFGKGPDDALSNLAGQQSFRVSPWIGR